MAPAPRPAIPVILLVLAAFISGCSAASVFTVMNLCPTMVYMAATESSNGTLALGLQPRGDTTHFVLTAGTSGTIWGRTGCTFDTDGRGQCQTGDCEGDLFCKLSGKQPLATLAEFTLGDELDYYGISLVDGFNIPMAFGCRDSGRPGLLCMDPTCPDANHRPDDEKIFTCNANSTFYITFCPF